MCSICVISAPQSWGAPLFSAFPLGTNLNYKDFFTWWLKRNYLQYVSNRTEKKSPSPTFLWTNSDGFEVCAIFIIEKKFHHREEIKAEQLVLSLRCCFSMSVGPQAIFNFSLSNCITKEKLPDNFARFIVI